VRKTSPEVSPVKLEHPVTQTILSDAGQDRPPDQTRGEIEALQGCNDPGTKAGRGKLCLEPAGGDDIGAHPLQERHTGFVGSAQRRRGLAGRISIRVLIVRGGDLSR